ncbi:MAG: response regulator [Planctomycetes bacterium]|nr:response regulator [Planctomycetota bacterium]
MILQSGSFAARPVRPPLARTLCLPLFLIGLLCLSAGAIAVEQTVRHRLADDLGQRARLLSEAALDLAERADGPAELTRYFLALNRAGEVRLALLLARRPLRVLAASVPEWNQRDAASIPDPALGGHVRRALERVGEDPAFGDDGDTFDVAVAVRLGNRRLGGETRGTDAILHLALDSRVARARLTPDVALLTGSLLGGTVLLLIASWWLMRRHVLQPARALRRVMIERAKGDALARAPSQHTAEFDLLALTLNGMLDALREREAITSTILEAAADAVVTVRGDGVIESCNAAAERLFGYPRSELLGRDVRVLVPADRQDELLARLAGPAEAQPEEPIRPVELVALRRGGAKVPVSLAASRVVLPDRLLYTGIFRDMTLLKEQDAQLQALFEEARQANDALREAKAGADAANRAKSEFLASMSHEIRTPMTAILGFTETLLEPGLSAEERAQALETVRRNGHHLLEIVNDILDLSKIEAGKLSIENLPCSAVGLVHDVVEMIRAKAAPKGLDLRLSFLTPVPATVQTDPTRLRQVLVNLLGNAVKFTERGWIELRVAFEPGASPALRFEIVDTGIGMSAEQMERLFRPFEQAEASTARRFGGTGLGLAITRRLVDLLGGSIAVQSVVGHGTAFTVRVATGSLEGVPLQHPLTIAVPEQDSPKESPVPDASPVSVRVLLAEDGPDNQRLISHVLRKAGAEVEVVADGAAAVQQVLAAEAANHAFDVVLMDMQMPILDGYGAVQELRAKGYRRPIVALTANTMAGDRERCLAAGCDEFASKPIDRQVLVATIRKLAQCNFDGRATQA